MVSVFFKLKQYFQFVVIENSIMEDARSDNVLSESDTSLIAKNKKQSRKTMASTILTTIGVPAFCALL